jgi:hypothetical protein
MFAIALALAAHGRVVAAEPPPLQFVRTLEGGWQSVLDIPASETIVRGALLDPIAAARFAPDIRTIAYVERGDCSRLRAVTTGIPAVAYVYGRCPTADGWHETLVSSEDLDAYEVRWRFAPRGPGTTVTYMVRIDPRWPAPDFLVDRQVRSTMTTVLSRLYRVVTDPAPLRGADGEVSRTR